MTPADEIERVAAGEHADPHGVLGAHAAGGGIVVRAFRPGAESVRVLPQRGEPVELAQIHPAGIFEGTLPRRRTLPRYRLEVGYPGAAPVVLRDPYSFAPTLGELDLHLITEGRHEQLWNALGAHPQTIDGTPGTAFAVWAPAARAVSVAGDFNAWNERAHPMRTLGSAGVWELFVPEAAAGHAYKFAIRGADGEVRLKADPIAKRAELPPKTGSIVFDPGHRWNDGSGRSGGAAPSRMPRRCRSTRSTSAPGG